MIPMKTTLCVWCLVQICTVSIPFSCDVVFLIAAVVLIVSSTIWRCPKMGVSANHPKIDHFSIETLFVFYYDVTSKLLCRQCARILVINPHSPSILKTQPRIKLRVTGFCQLFSDHITFARLFSPLLFQVFILALLFGTK
jgi:hypothetical protein